jgi:alkylhydroperoxidase family enzyme
LSGDALRQAEQREAEVIGSGPRIEHLMLTEFSPELLAILVRMENVNEVLKSGAEGDRGGTQSWRDQVMANPRAAARSPEILASINRLPEIFRTMLHHPQLFVRHTEVGLQLLAGGVLSLRDREFAVLRIAWLCQAPYEWGEHVLVGRRFGLDGADIARIIEGPDAAGLSEHERAILRAVDELHGDAMISDATWDTLAKVLDEQQLIELPIIVGQYQSVAYYQNSLRLRLHAGNLGLKAR